MESLDLHPEELFDKADAGFADSDELARIDAHLAACATCRLERQVRRDFDAVTVSPEEVERLLAGALVGSSTPRAVTPLSVPATRRRRLGPYLIAAALLTGMVSFASVTGWLPKWFEASVEAPPPAPPVAQPARIATPKVAAPEPVVEEPVAIPPPAPVVRVTKRVQPPAPEPEPVVVEPDAMTLFSRAHTARIEGRRSDAVNELQGLVARFPGEAASAMALAELGTLWLEGGEPTRALEAFDTYLSSSHGLLREEVLTARAQAFAILKQPDDERAAWERLIQEFPVGLSATRARARLEALSQ